MPGGGIGYAGKGGEARALDPLVLYIYPLVLSFLLPRTVFLPTSQRPFFAFYVAFDNLHLF